MDDKGEMVSSSGLWESEARPSQWAGRPEVAEKWGYEYLLSGSGETEEGHEEELEVANALVRGYKLISCPRRRL